MCSRFEMNARPGELARRFGLKAAPPLPNTPELRPTDQALVIGTWAGDEDGEDGPAPRILGWGLAVTWDAKPLINARAETLTRKPTFRPLLDTRCLVPATAYFEWRKVGKVKLKNRIALSEGGVFAFAGLTDGERFTIVTCAPQPAIAHIHERMPVILDRRAESPWIDSDVSFAEVSGLLVPYGAEPLKAEEETPTGQRSFPFNGP